MTTRRTQWHWAELAAIRVLYPMTPTTVIAAGLGRSVLSVYNVAHSMGLHKSAEYLASSDCGRLRKGIRRSRATEFMPGNVPHNKGLRRPGYAPGRMAETQFKPGVRQGIAAKNWRPIGTILPDAEGYLRIKVREGNKGEAYGFGNTKIWPLLSRHVWEQNRGPIPPSHTVVFKDRDRGNCDINNLELISRRELMARNTVHNLPKELVEVIQLNGALNRRLRRLNEKQNVGLAEPSLRDAGSAEGRGKADGY